MGVDDEWSYDPLKATVDKQSYEQYNAWLLYALLLPKVCIWTAICLHYIFSRACKSTQKGLPGSKSFL